MTKQIFKFLLPLSFLLSLITSNAQQVGTWTSHLPYKNGQKVCEVENKIFCVVENGLFFFDKDDNTTTKITRDDGLSDIEITSIKYHTGLKKIILGYNSGQIDILDEKLNVTNLTDIYRSTSVVSSKAINEISFYNNLAYLSTDFGIVVLDIENLEIKESYRNIGPTGEEIKVKNVIINPENKNIYCHNEFGISTAKLDSLNLLNFESWEFIKDSLGENQNSIDYYTFYQGKLHGAISKTGIYYYDTDSLEFYKTNQFVLNWSNLNAFSVSNDQLITTYFHMGFLYDTTSSSYSKILEQRDNRDMIVDKDGFHWAAVKDYGLTSDYSGEVKEYSPDGTTSSFVFSMYSNDNEVIVLSGGYNGSAAPTWSTQGFYVYSDFGWTNYNKTRTDGHFDDYRDVLDAQYDPLRKKYFIATYVSGLVVWDGDTTYTKLTAEDSTDVPFLTVGGQTRITSVTTDNNNNIWVTNHHDDKGGNPTIHKLKPDNTWESFLLQENKAKNPFDLLIDDSNQKWIIADNESLVVWDEATNEERTLSTSTGKGALPSNRINCITKDRNGQIWVGTDAGVAVFSDPSEALTSSFYEASLPIFAQRPLLQDEQVTSITVDGANRKWFGTSSGAFLFDENGTESINVFNKENSLIPSNFINDIAINESTGEVFFGTGSGLVSFWGDATEPEDTFGEAKIFPNPINPEYDGYVTINGLRENSAVKITDVSGKLVYQQNSNGGTATWDTKTLQGDKVQTGVYLIYATDLEFEESFIGKLVIVH